MADIDQFETIRERSERLKRQTRRLIPSLKLVLVVALLLAMLAVAFSLLTRPRVAHDGTIHIPLPLPPQGR
jgi:hypothetical protein